MFNPRRDNWEDLSIEALKEQVKWEHEALRQADLVFFWFPKETLCPITLFELGGQMEIRNTSNLMIGSSINYPRVKDLLAQLTAHNKCFSFSVVDDPKELTGNILSKLKNL